MSIKPNDLIHAEVHDHTSQFIRVEKGDGVAIVNGKKYALSDGISIIVSPGQHHKILNTSNKNDLKLYTIYSPPEHPPLLV